MIMKIIPLCIKNTSEPTTNTDNTSDNNKNQNGTLLKAGDVGPNSYLIILGFILIGSGIGLLTLKKIRQTAASISCCPWR